MKTTAEMRQDIIDVANGREPGNEPSYTARNPFRKVDLVQIIEHLTGEEVDEGQEKSRIQFKLLEEMGEDPDPFDASTPMRKHEIRKLHEQIVR